MMDSDRFSAAGVHAGSTPCWRQEFTFTDISYKEFRNSMTCLAFEGASYEKLAVTFTPGSIEIKLDKAQPLTLFRLANPSSEQPNSLIPGKEIRFKHRNHAYAASFFEGKISKKMSNLKVRRKDQNYHCIVKKIVL